MSDRDLERLWKFSNDLALIIGWLLVGLVVVFVVYGLIGVWRRHKRRMADLRRRHRAEREAREPQPDDAWRLAGTRVPTDPDAPMEPGLASDEESTWVSFDANGPGDGGDEERAEDEEDEDEEDEREDWWKRGEPPPY